MGRDIKISGVKGDVFGIDVKGTSNIITKEVTGTININIRQLEKMPNEYAKSLQVFSENVSEQLKKHNIPPERVAPVQESINELAKEIEDVKPEVKVGIDKKISIEAKLKTVTARLLKLLPKTAETIATFTPLAPFSKLIGQSVEEIVNTIQKEV